MLTEIKPHNDTGRFNRHAGYSSADINWQQLAATNAKIHISCPLGHISHQCADELTFGTEKIIMVNHFNLS